MRSSDMHIATREVHSSVVHISSMVSLRIVVLGIMGS
jgi:hypothetical protein